MPPLPAGHEGATYATLFTPYVITQEGVAYAIIFLHMIATLKVGSATYYYGYDMLPIERWRWLRYSCRHYAIIKALAALRRQLILPLRHYVITREMLRRH